jgi:large subunit ribosomal protein L4
MQIDIVNVDGKKVGSADLDDAVFGAKVKDYLLWELVKAQQAAKRAGTHSTKTRANVQGGGKKPYKQKGTGNARQGSSRAPNHVGGGKVFGPHPRSKEKKIVVVDKLAFDAPKTKTMAGILKTLGLAKALVVDEKGNTNLFKSVRNLAKAKVLAPEGLNVFDILNHSDLVIAAGAIKSVEQRVLPAAAEKAA